MLTELKKTVHIVVDDMNAVPDETMIQHALNGRMKVMKVMHSGQVPGSRGIAQLDKDSREMCFQEYGDALQAAGKSLPPADQVGKVCPPIDSHNVSYHIWTVDMHFSRACSFEPKATPLRSIVQHVDEKCRQIAEAVLDEIQLTIARDRVAQTTDDVARKLHELFQDGMFSLSD